MKRIISVMLTLLLISCAGIPARVENKEAYMERFMENPREVRNIGDPFILQDQGYHLFATGEAAGFWTISAKCSMRISCSGLPSGSRLNSR